MSEQIYFASSEIAEKYGLPTMLIASVIFCLTKKGQVPTCMSENYIAQRSLVSKRMVAKTKKQLKQGAYIDYATKKTSSGIASEIVATQKLIDAFEGGIAQRALGGDEHGSLGGDAQRSSGVMHSVHEGDEQCALGDEYDALGGSARGALGSAQCASGVMHAVHGGDARGAWGECTPCTRGDAQCAHINKYIKKYKEIESKEESNEKEIYARENFDDCAQMSENDVHDFLTIPFADDYDFEDHDELKNDIAEPTPLKSKTPQAEEKKNSAKRKERKPRAVIEYPKNAAEVLKLMQAWKEKHVGVEPRIQGVNLELESEKFFDYWEEHNWTNKRGKIKSMNSTVATWLGFAIDKVKGNYTAPAPVPAPENDRPKISVFDAVERGLCKNLDEASALANADGWIFEDQLKNVVDAEFEIVEDEPLALER